MIPLTDPRRRAPNHKPVIGARGHDHLPDESTSQTRVVDHVRDFRRELATRPSKLILVRSSHEKSR